MNEPFNEDHTHQTYRFLNRSRVAVCTQELISRVFSANWVDSEDAFVEACREFNGLGNVWALVNKAGKGVETANFTSADITSWTILPLDIDAKRKATEKEIEAGIEPNQKDPATDDEVQEAILVGIEIVTWLKDKFGITDYLFIMTGNGCAIWVKIPAYPINEDNWKETQEKSQAFQHMIKERFNTPHVQIDAVGDLKRIMKIPGTLAVKGKETLERKHRLATIIEEGNGDE